MRICHVLFITALISTACGTSSRMSTATSTTAKTVATADEVRAFASTVARNVTRRGPAAWRDYFDDSSSFFMASEGHLVFADGDAAIRGIEELSRTISQIDLRWGEGVRVEPLTPTLAMLAAPFHEVLVDTAGHRVEETGYFTGLVERGPGGWKFRNAHWSTVNSTTP
jgi:hypothetical protein